MTDATDIAALRSEAANIIGLLTTEGHQSFTLDKAADFFDDAFRLLEAERQRADEAHKYGSERDAENESLMLTVGRLRTELAALKGDQVPVAWLNDAHLARGHIEGEAGEDDAGPGMIPVYRGKFTASQKPVVTVGFLFIVEATGQVIYSCADTSIEGAQLIGQIYGDAAIEDAGSIVKDGE